MRRLSSTWDRHAHEFRFAADAPEEAIPNIVRVVRPAIFMLLNDGVTRRWRFRFRGDRDQFVHTWKHVGARNARK